MLGTDQNRGDQENFDWNNFQMEKHIATKIYLKAIVSLLLVPYSGSVDLTRQAMATGVIDAVAVGVIHNKKSLA